MEKLGVIGTDIATGAHATYSFWKHVFQLLIEILTFGYLQFEIEREKISEDSLKEINGRYLKFTKKHVPDGNGALKSEIMLTPMGETLLAGDSLLGIEDFGDNSAEFMSQIEKLNESWYIFAGLALLFAVGAFFIQRSLVR